MLMIYIRLYQSGFITRASQIHIQNWDWQKPDTVETEMCLNSNHVLYDDNKPEFCKKSKI